MAFKYNNRMLKLSRMEFSQLKKNSSCSVDKEIFFRYFHATIFNLKNYFIFFNLHLHRHISKQHHKHRIRFPLTNNHSHCNQPNLDIYGQSLNHLQLCFLHHSSRLNHYTVSQRSDVIVEKRFKKRKKSIFYNGDE